MNGEQWRLTSRGWIGTIPLSRDLHVVLEPKVTITSLFRMLEWAYDLESFKVLPAAVASESLDDMYDRLASILASLVLKRARRGLYRAYVPEEDRLPYVRGSLQVREMMRRPWDPDLPCQYHDHTADVIENQILAWTLFTIGRSGVITRSRDSVRAAYRAVHDSTTLRHFSAQACIARLYNRLNDDYRMPHALCRFFLEHAGPSHELGDRKVFPFLVNMGRLYERFVARWLARHLPAEYRLVAQERVTLHAAHNLGINIDLVVYDSRTNEPVFVLDTKYKNPDSPSPEDISQVVSYAVAKRARTAVLIYPVEIPRPYDGAYGAGDIRVRTLHFGLEGDLDAAGRQFVGQLLEID
jgi:5-methylcytosine-specific restriction enzyme subunit McrC